MDKPRTYEAEYKKEAVKLAKEVGARKASAFFAARRQKSGKSKD